MMRGRDFLKHFQQGLTHQQIADIYNITRQAVSAQYKKYQEQGLVPPVKRGRRGSGNVPRYAKQDFPESEKITLEQIEELIITRFEEAREVRKLRNQLAATENELLNARNELERLKRYYKDQLEKQRRFVLAQQQGEIKPLLTHDKQENNR
jgi:DNA-binding transcriptional ArsR family regulator